jgi:putative two-component system response regulator
MSRSTFEDGAVGTADAHVFDPAIALFTAVRQVTDEVLHAHENKVGEIAGVLGEALGQSDDQVAQLVKASSLHDIGKFAIPSTILGKNGPLTPEEILEIQKHASNGAQILLNAGYGPDDMPVQVARYHHEKFDGTGYPDGLVGRDIPLAARITAVADVYDALRALRPYKAPIDHETALRIINEGDGRTRPEHFDPEVLQALSSANERVRSVWDASSGMPES